MKQRPNENRNQQKLFIYKQCTSIIEDFIALKMKLRQQINQRSNKHYNKHSIMQNLNQNNIHLNNNYYNHNTTKNICNEKNIDICKWHNNNEIFCLQNLFLAKIKKNLSCLTHLKLLSSLSAASYLIISILLFISKNIFNLRISAKFVLILLLISFHLTESAVLKTSCKKVGEFFFNILS